MSAHGRRWRACTPGLATLVLGVALALAGCGEGDVAVVRTAGASGGGGGGVYHVGPDYDGGGFISPAGQQLYGGLITVPAPTNVLGLGLISRSSSGSYRMVLYTDNAGAPDALVAYTAVETLAAARLEPAVLSPAPVAAGAYWIMIQTPSTAISVAADSGSTGTNRYTSNNIGSLPPDPIGGTIGSSNTNLLNFYLIVQD